MGFHDSRIAKGLIVFCVLVAAGESVAQAQQTGPAQNSPPAAPSKPRFDVFEFRVEGNSTLDQESIERAVYPFLGEGKTIDDVEAARAKLETVYRDKGFGTVLVQIPIQQVTAGVVKLHVEEGRVERIDVVGAKYYSQGRILDTVKSLAPGEVPNFPKVQEELAQVNTGSDIKVNPLLRAGAQPGTTDVDLEVTDSLPLHGSVTVDDYYTPSTKAMRLTGAIDYDNLFQQDQKLSILYQTSPQDTSEVKLASVSYTIPVARQFLVLSYVRSDSNTVAAAGGLDLVGRGEIIGIHDVIPLGTKVVGPGDYSSNQLTAGVDYKNFDQNVTLGSNASGGFDTPIAYVPFTVAYSGNVTHGPAQWDYGASLEFALRDFGNTASEFDAKRYQALSNFLILKFNLARVQPLPYGLSLNSKLEIQAADQPLVSNEEMVVGGNESVRGYLTASAAGDTGARASFELESPNFLSEPVYSFTSFTTHAFVDGAYVKILSPLPGQVSSFELLGSGFGLRAKSGQTFTLNLDLAWPMRSIEFTRAWSPRLQGAATVSF
jgi:hemolysin activation/secretion protein